MRQVRRALQAAAELQPNHAAPYQLPPDGASAVSLFVVLLLIALLLLLLGSQPPAEAPGALTLSILI